MPKGVHSGMRGRKPKSDAQRIAEGKAPRHGNIRDRSVGTKRKKEAEAKAKLAAMRRGEAIVDTGGKKKRAAKPTTPTLIVMPMPTLPTPDAPEGGMTTITLRPPKRMSPQGLEVWNEFAEILPHTGLIFKPSDGPALATLCEDEALMADAYQEVMDGARALMDVAAEQGRALNRPPLAAFLSAGDGARLARVLNAISMRVAKQRADFGLTPASRLRLTNGADMDRDQLDDIEAGLCEEVG